MNWTLNGIPMHPLFVHGAVMLVPITAFAMILVAVWPAAQRKLGISVPILSIVAAISVAFTIQAGEALEERVKETALVQAHTEAADGIVPWIVLLVVAACVQWLVFRFVKNRKDADKVPAFGATARKVIAVVVGLLVVAGAVGATWEIYLVGDAGAKSVWDGNVN